MFNLVSNEIKLITVILFYFLILILSVDVPLKTKMKGMEGTHIEQRGKTKDTMTSDNTYIGGSWKNIM